MDFSPILTLETCANCKICCIFKPESLVYVPKGLEVKEQKDGEFACAHRCEKEGCTLGKNKPMECAMWPFSVSKRGKELFLVLEHSCPELNKKENKEKAKRFVLESFEPAMLEYSRQNFDMLREYDERNEVIKTYDS